MPRSFKLNLNLKLSVRDPRTAVRLGLGVLLLANLVAALFVFKPWGRSATDLQEESANVQRQIAQKQARIRQLRQVTSQSSGARQQSSKFQGQYLLEERTAYSTIVSELLQDYRKSNVLMKDHSFVQEPVEGSETVSNLILTARLEGTYRDLLALLYEIDHSPRFLTVEFLSATPQQGGRNLDITLRVSAYLRNAAPATGAAL